LLTDLVEELNEAGEVGGLAADGVVGFAREVVGEDAAGGVHVGGLPGMCYRVVDGNDRRQVTVVRDGHEDSWWRTRG
jgi:hypothetical protein